MLTVIPDTVFPALPVLPKIFHLISQCRSKEILPISLEIMQHPLGVLTRSLPHCTFVPNIRIYAEEGIEADDILGTMAKKAGVDEYVVKRLAGHKITDVTEAVYTIRDIE
jgi:hypothetical protein